MPNRALLPTCLLPLCLAWTAMVAAGESSQQLTFERDIRPILKTHCFQCHGEAGVVEGELDVRLRRWMLAGGESGEAIVPGDPAASLLLQRVISGEMPPKDHRPSPEEVAKLRDWIAQGANTLRAEPESIPDDDYFTEEDRAFWSFQPIRRPALPADELAEVDNPIDAFILQQLHAHGLEFSPPADPATLIRRVTFDLLGLPPDPLAVDAFVADPNPSAYIELIDRLLADPRYGERWGRHWLDVAGYADSEGYTNQDTEREFAYFYRDYVIRSLNSDKPLDQFVCEQLAGDEMQAIAGTDASDRTPQSVEQLTATGFLRMAPDGTATAGAERDVAANETIAETIHIVSTSLLGLTVGCARCHDHRYDPISHADYYRFRAIFEPALNWKKWQIPDQRQISLYTAADREARAVVEAQAKEAEAARTVRQQEHIERTLYEELLVAPDEKRAALKAAFEVKNDLRTPEQVALLEEYPNIGNISSGSLYLYAEQRERRAKDIETVADQREARFLLQVRDRALNALPEAARTRVLATIDTAEQAGVAVQVADASDIAAEFPGVFVTPQSLEMWDPEGFAEVARYREAAKICRQQDAKTELAKMQEEVNRIRSTAPKENFIRALTETGAPPPDTFLFVRGDHNQPSQRLLPAELSVLSTAGSQPIPEDDPQLPTTGRRLAYARHLTDGKHPLLARVLVNRVWLHHFGRGIVETPGDFGRLGAGPTHPGLLDWLADQLMHSGWQLKQLHRAILLSRTYQQQSARSEWLDEVDPDNRLYARMSVRRLESEAIRDAVLTASGAMLAQMHGPPVPVKEDAVGQIVLGKEALDGERKPTGEDTELEGAARRSLYIQVRRSRPLAVLETFDIATVTPNCTQRNYSNVATQSLLMMNSQFMIGQAERMASRLMAAESELSSQLELAWKLCYSRPIDSGALDELLAFVEGQAAAFRRKDDQLAMQAAQAKALASVCQALLSANEFIYVD